MAVASLNGISVVRGAIDLPRTGIWHADLDLAADADVPLGPATIDLGPGDLQLHGSVVRSGSSRGAIAVRVVGGAGGFGNPARAKGYLNIPVRLVLSDILSAAGESLASSSDAGALGIQLEHWQVLAQPTSDALARLLERLPDGTAWRMLPDGTFWVGPETWPEAQLEHVVLLESPNLGRRELSFDSPTLLPGVVLDGVKVDFVSHRIEPARLRSLAWGTA